MPHPHKHARKTRAPPPPAPPQKNRTGTLSGVIGVAVTGWILDANGGAAERAGWYQAHMVCAGICLKACSVFAVFARGEKLFD
jgi:MFS transporter, ACS family, solute carrier family 17 (sodium-dependent inorganic phosphate cotransporter), other